MMDQTYEERLLDHIQKDDRLMVLTAENRAIIRGLPEKIGNRFVDTGITEQCMVGVAAGLALRGRVPVIHALASFLTMRAFEFLRTDVGIPNLPVKAVGFVPGLLSDGNGPTHQAIEDLSLMRGIPNMQVFAPADFEDLMLGLDEILDDPRPWYIRYNQRPAVVSHQRSFQVGRAEILSKGKDIGVLTYGTLFGEVHEAVESLKKDGRSVGLANLRTLKPVDEDTILEFASSCSLLVTVEDHFLTGGLSTIVSEVLLRNRMTANHLPIAFEERWYTPGSFARVLESEGLTPGQIANRIQARWESA